MGKKKAARNRTDDQAHRTQSKVAPHGAPATVGSQSVLKGLSNVWKQWSAIMKERGIWDGIAGPEDCERIRLGLQKFHPSTQLSHEDVICATMAISKGKALVEAALKWDDPIVGAGKAASNVVRGEQWRLMMAWGGLETIVKTLLRLPKQKGLDDAQMKSFVDLCGLPACVSIAPPKKGLKALEAWLTKGERDGEHHILAFLGVERGDATAIKGWIIEGRGVESWPAAMKLAKAIRNATGHGALLPKKVSGWGLRKAIRRLTLDIGQLATGAVKQLSKIE